MRATVGLLFLTVALAGCGSYVAPNTSPTPTDGPHGPQAPLGTIAFSTPTTLGSIWGGAEPSVAVAPDGTAYVTTPLAMWRSDDGGKTWTDLGPPGCPQGIPACPGLADAQPPQGLTGAGDGDLYISTDGRVHWLGLYGANGKTVPYQVSSDKGKTWSKPVDLAGGEQTDRQWISGRDSNGTLYGVWRNFGSGNRSGVMVTASYDNGTTWYKKSAKAWEDGRTDGISIDPTSTTIGFTYEEPSDNSIQWVYSQDEGRSWNMTVVHEGGQRVNNRGVATFDEAGNLYVVYSKHMDGVSPASGTGYGGTPVIYFAKSTDKGATFSQPKPLNAPGTTGWYPWLAAGKAGSLVVVWYQNDNGLPRELSEFTYVMAAVTIDAQSANPTWSTVRIRPEAIHWGPECRNSPGCTRSLLDFFEVAIHPKGYPIVSWAEDVYPSPYIKVVAAYMTQGPALKR